MQRRCRLLVKVRGWQANEPLGERGEQQQWLDIEEPCNKPCNKARDEQHKSSGCRHCCRDNSQITACKLQLQFAESDC